MNRIDFIKRLAALPFVAPLLSGSRPEQITAEDDLDAVPLPLEPHKVHGTYGTKFVEIPIWNHDAGAFDLVRITDNEVYLAYRRAFKYKDGVLTEYR